MTIFDYKNIFMFVGGIGMFLYGMSIMSTGLQKLTGDRFANLIRALTNSLPSAILIGALVTAVLHSSAATTVMTVGFVNAGIMTLNQAVGVIMGANIGTTITSWLVSLTGLGDLLYVLKPDFYAPIVFGVAAIIVTFAKSELTKNKANIFVGLGLLFLGLTYMASGVAPYAKSHVFIKAFEVLGRNPILAILAGAVITAILSSSTASVSILQTLALAGSVSKSAACFITVGQNIGTCVTTILSSAKSSKNGKRTALMHLLFNVIGGFVFTIAVLALYPFIKDYLQTNISIFEISIFHTGFNIINTILLLPFSNILVRLSKKIIKDNELDDGEISLADKTKSILDERLLTQPSVAIATVRGEVIYYARYTLKNIIRSTNLITGNRSDELINNVVSHEEQIDKTTFLLIDYLSKINKLNLAESDSLKVEHLMSMCNDIERIGDHAENISEKAKQMLDNDVLFSNDGKIEVSNIIDLSIDSIKYAIDALEKKDLQSIANVRKIENKVDDLVSIFTENHMKRMSEGICNTFSGMVFLDLLSNLERVTDHANNIADYMEAENENKSIIDVKY